MSRTTPQSDNAVGGADVSGDAAVNPRQPDMAHRPAAERRASLGERAGGTGPGRLHPSPGAQAQDHELERLLSQVSMVCANFGNAEAFEAVLLDWFVFLGGRAGEVVVVDGGSCADTHRMYFDLFNRRLIDKLQLIRREHPDNSRETCFIQEHTAPAVASGEYLLFFKSDTLPYRSGHDRWLVEAAALLERDDVFAVGGSFNVPSRHHDGPLPGWYFSDKCSENFALMKRSSFIDAIGEFAGQYVSSGWRGRNPAGETGQSRYLIEVAFEQYIQRHRRYTAVRVEDPSWTVFHTNAAGKALLDVRERYLARENIEPFMNAGRVNRLHGGCYYGKPRDYLLELRCAVGRGPLGPVARGARQLACELSSALTRLTHTRGVSR